MPKTKLERLQAKVKIEQSTGCWLWQGRKSDNGYGVFHWETINGNDIPMVAHRAAYLLLRGEIPEETMLRHQCNVASCCNPDHMKFGTHKDNMRDRAIAGRVPSGENHYKFKRKEPLIKAFKSLRSQGLMVDEICKILGCGRNTYYRASKRDNELQKINIEARSDNCAAAAIQRVIDNPESVARGEKSGCAKISAIDVRDIRRMRLDGMGLRELANRYNITESAVCAICKRKNWKHVS